MFSLRVPSFAYNSLWFRITPKYDLIRDIIIWNFCIRATQISAFTHGFIHIYTCSLLHVLMYVHMSMNLHIYVCATVCTKANISNMCACEEADLKTYLTWYKIYCYINHRKNSISKLRYTPERAIIASKMFLLNSWDTIQFYSCYHLRLPESVKKKS